jgi:hypothetical protein
VATRAAVAADVLLASIQNAAMRLLAGSAPCRGRGSRGLGSGMRVRNRAGVPQISVGDESWGEPGLSSGRIVTQFEWLCQNLARASKERTLHASPV